jgi:hypothetical protein
MRENAKRGAVRLPFFYLLPVGNKTGDLNLRQEK